MRAKTPAPHTDSPEPEITHHGAALAIGGRDRDHVTEAMLLAAMRAFEPMSSVLRYRVAEKWHACDIMGMREAIAAALAVYRSHPRNPAE
jgi:hypothetical protein